MPKLVDYPSASFQRCLEMADAINSLGGACTKETCAHQMGKKITGAFTTQIGAAVKYNLINAKKGDLSISEKYKSIKLAYSESEKRQYEVEAFLAPPVFNKLHERFLGKKLPEEILDKLLIKEFAVEERMSQKVAGYFISGLKYLRLIDESGKIAQANIQSNIEEESTEQIEEVEEVSQPNNQLVKRDSPAILQESDDYIVHIKGPGIDSQIVIKEHDDLTIVTAMLNKVKNKLQ